ncbi:calcium uniporter protein, mitochondrial isoform X2 [Cynocephalus volans]|uniref:calcium uniporter protein, mitochondrial isoform X2 n=1 Tax=Cynocephalus volans TaxID=110931 RepID=UPI002FCB0376
MAAAAGRPLLLLLSSRGGGGGGGGCGALTAGCFPGLGVSRHRQQQHHRTMTLKGIRTHGLSVVSTTLSQVHRRPSSWQNLGVVYCSTVVPSDDVTVVYQNGLPVISVKLPSRRERCQFTLKPISDSVGVFLRQLQEEDRGIDRVAIYSPDGVRVAASTGIDLLLLDDFKLVINDLTYHVQPPKRDLLSHENAATLNDVKTLVQQLYTTLCIEQHQLNKERELIERLEDLKEQLAPLEKVRIEISRKAEKRTTLVLWGGLAYMATQFGILARLTWWEYSWDIMEPVTYFITYGSAMAMYAYFVITRQEYVYPEARDRQYLLFFHKGAKKTRFDLEKYNQLKDAIAQKWTLRD